MRTYLPSITGNVALKLRLGRDLEQGTFSHAYILEGPSGIGKATMATELVMALACEQSAASTRPLPCHTCKTCRKIVAGNSPDVIHIRREDGKASMGVDTVRALRADVTAVPNDLAFKVYIIHDAHTMTVQAQNALLLTLEEPPAFVIFLLLCENASALLETIRSRAPVLRMQPVTDAEIRGYLLSSERSGEISRTASELCKSAPDDFAAILRMAGGRIGTALTLLGEEKRAPLMENRKIVLEICRLLAEHNRTDELLTALVSLGKKREEVTNRLLLLETALRDLLLLHYSETAEPLFFTDRENAAEQSTRFTARNLLHAIRAVEEAVATLGANGNVRLALMQLLIKLTTE